MKQDQDNRVYCKKEGLIKMTIFIITRSKSDMVEDDFSICF